jgi:hypothetical protein
MSKLSVEAKKLGVTEEELEYLLQLQDENTDIPLNIEEERDEIISSWSEYNILKNSNNSIQFTLKSTIDEIGLIKAGKYIDDFFVGEKNIILNILDIMSGNGIASDYIFQILKPKIGRWISTDIIDFKKPKLNEKQFYKLNTVDSIKKYGKISNVLLIISPIPGESYADYFACKDFIEQTKYDEKKYIIFIGELGRGDGTTGMYKYLLKHVKLNMLLEKEIHTYKNDGFTVNKKLYIFEIDKNKCNYCGKTDAKYKCICTVRYCGKDCQHKDFINHKSICDKDKIKEIKRIRDEREIEQIQKKIEDELYITKEEREKIINDSFSKIEIDRGVKKTRKRSRKSRTKTRKRKSITKKRYL